MTGDENGWVGDGIDAAKPTGNELNETANGVVRSLLAYDIGPHRTMATLAGDPEWEALKAEVAAMRVMLNEMFVSMIVAKLQESEPVEVAEPTRMPPNYSADNWRMTDDGWVYEEPDQ